MSKENEVLEFLEELESSDEEIRIEVKKERTRLALALAMVRSRKASGLSQLKLAGRLGVTQGWVSKLENPDIAHTFDSILDYLQAVGAELDMALIAEGKEFPVSRTTQSPERPTSFAKFEVMTLVSGLENASSFLRVSAGFSGREQREESFKFCVREFEGATGSVGTGGYGDYLC
ncbi:MAG: helix-turn-helix domain-containing protein [Thermoanaerobaculales bacterium]|nr:helix-turn-helix domain-containing protein [Thermoanaerobaculales bacterium]